MAADRGRFDAIGCGDMKITIPGPGNKLTSITLKNVLYAPRLSMTLISISKITAAGGSVLFSKDFCRIYDKNWKITGEIKMQNGLYQVEHQDESISGMTIEPIKRILIEELHRRMGHIASEAAK
jgi:hypothetical protein